VKISGSTTGRISLRAMKRKAAARMMATILGKVRFARQSRDLNDGYFTSLTIMKRGRTMMNGQDVTPRRFCEAFVQPARSSNQSRKSVSEATVPAAAGIGKPRKSLLAPLPPRGETVVKRASRNAPQIKYTDAMNQPISGCFSKDVVQHNAMHQKKPARRQRK